MSYTAQAQMAHNADLIDRVTACAASFPLPAGMETTLGPAHRAWVEHNRWRIAASQGWANIWQRAVTAGNENPGSDEALIKDSMILLGITALLGEPNPTP